MVGTAELRGPVTSFRFSDSLEGPTELNRAIPLRFKFVAMKGKRRGGLGLGGVQASLPPCRSADSACSPSFDVWQHMESGQPGIVTKPWCPGFLLRVIYIVTADHNMADLSHGTSRGQTMLCGPKPPC